MWSVYFVFLSYLDRNVVKGDSLSRALDAEKESKEMFSLLNSTFCVKTSAARDNFLHQVSDGAEVVRSVVSPAGKLMDCSVIVNQLQVKSFMQECRLGLKEQRAGPQLGARFARMDEAKVMCREFKENLERSGSIKTDESEYSVLMDKVLKRSKRGFTYPGTLWCGAGNMADHYDQLGEFAETDGCCRIHDHCPNVIHAFSSNYGYTNFKWHSICHCDCDNRLKDCLRKVNDTSSRVVGQAFFNVIGVPCFEFTYEEQCAERHWYGMCKRYEQFPIAVLKQAVPYDFGGIDVIDKLPLPPLKTTDSKKSEKDETESTTESTTSGPEEPSLRNVVTAAEDFIKVLATVSTSQSSATDSDKGETQSSEKKKKKDTEKKKKTNKKQRGKGKLRKRKQKVEAGMKIEERTAISTSGSKAEEVKALSNFIRESHKHNQSSRNINRVGDRGYELGGKEEPSNEVMKDEPAKDKETVCITSPATLQRKPESTAESTPSTSTGTTSVAQQKPKTKLRKGWRKKSKSIPPSSSEALPVITGDASVPTIITIPPLAQPEQQSFGSDAEKRLGVSTVKTPIVSPKVKRNRSKERGDREGSKKRRKDSSASPIVATPNENSSMHHLKVIPPMGAPTEPSVSHRLDIYGGKMTDQVTSLNSSFNLLKMQKLQERGLRSSRRKSDLSLSSKNRHFHKNKNVLSVLPSPETSEAQSSPATTAAFSRPTEETETHSEWRLCATITVAPSITTKRHRQTIRQQRKSRKRAKSAAVSDRVSVLEQTPMTFTDAPSKVATTGELNLWRSDKTTSATPIMSPIQLSVERAKAQFSRKKRRKAARSLSQQ